MWNSFQPRWILSRWNLKNNAKDAEMNNRYLVGYIGFIALFLLLGVIIFYLPLFFGVIFPSYIGYVLQIVGGYFAFKYVVQRNIEGKKR